MSREIPAAETQRNEMEGTVAIDWDGERDIFHFAESAGLDIEKNLPVAIEVDGETVSIYAVDMQLVGGTGEEIDNYAASHDGIVPVRKFNVRAAFSDLQRCIKRFSLVLETTELGECTKKYHFNEAETIDLDSTT